MDSAEGSRGVGGVGGVVLVSFPLPLPLPLSLSLSLSLFLSLLRNSLLDGMLNVDVVGFFVEIVIGATNIDMRRMW